MLIELTLAVFGSVALPPAAHDVKVYDHGHRLVRMYDGQPDGCERQWAFVFPHKHRDVAEQQNCWRPNTIDNLSSTNDTLHVTYQIGAKHGTL
jgi:hypothetical protein